MLIRALVKLRRPSLPLMTEALRNLRPVAHVPLEPGDNTQVANAHIRFDNSYARLPSRFFMRLAPTPVIEPRLVQLNNALAERLGLDPTWLSSPEGVAILSGNRIPEGADPLAAAYARHQFGHFVPQLGDGRAILLGELGRRLIKREARCVDASWIEARKLSARLS